VQAASAGWHAASALLRALPHAALQVLSAAWAGFSHVRRVARQLVAHATPSGAAKHVGYTAAYSAPHDDAGMVAPQARWFACAATMQLAVAGLRPPAAGMVVDVVVATFGCTVVVGTVGRVVVVGTLVVVVVRGTVLLVLVLVDDEDDVEVEVDVDVEVPGASGPSRSAQPARQPEKAILHSTMGVGFAHAALHAKDAAVVADRHPGSPWQFAPALVQVFWQSDAQLPPVVTGLHPFVPSLHLAPVEVLPQVLDEPPLLVSAGTSQKRSWFSHVAAQATPAPGAKQSGKAPS
jgi:hypothetical protein